MLLWMELGWVRKVVFDMGSDLIPHFSKRPQAPFMATGGLRKIREEPVQAFSCSQEDAAN
jgi:hypothetical protein